MGSSGDGDDGGANRNVWVLFEDSYLPGRIVFDDKSEDFVDISVESLGVTIPISRESVYEVNPDVSNFRDLDDLTSLRHLHEPAILHVLEGRSYADYPYTYLSGILVSVNPLVRSPEALKAGFQAPPGTYVPPHPFALAETAFQQMCFAAKNQDRSCISAQSIVIAGESGAGKTEVGKRVLQHLIKRSSAQSAVPRANGSQSLEQQLLGVNPILESFGNAATLRNHNSSRFGKFTKLHFDCGEAAKGGATLVHASICSYLLERSRIVFHGEGERSFRVFYELVNGADEALRAKAKLGAAEQALSGYAFKFIESKNQVAESDVSSQQASDRAAFESLVGALGAVGLGDHIDDIFIMVASILHLGNLDIDEEESEQGRVACMSGSHLEVEATVCGLLGLESGALRDLLCERTVNLPGGESVRVRRKLTEALEARNALAKSLYSALFDWLIARVNRMLAPDASAAEQYKDSYVGVLDIFGFETFALNDFEQLLINFANEALQETFREKVLVAEALLYRQEGLVIDDGGAKVPATTDAGSCLALLKGTKAQPGILHKLAAESECPNPRDERFVSTLHSAFAKHPLFVAPHPKDKQTTFIVAHYASDVTYTVGRFTQKNLDRLPKDAQAILGQASSGFVTEVLAATASSTGGAAPSAKRQQRTIASNFSRQIGSLVDDLNATQCSFVRCIKPNLTMRRDHDDGRWFDGRYVLDQLRCLGIAQTAKALRGGGFPTRIDYKDVMENFREQIPRDHFEACTKLLDVGSSASLDETARRRRRNARFIRALFWAFDIPQDAYRCGLTKVFFKPGALQKVDAMLAASREPGAAGPADGGDARLARFREHCARSAWRSCCTKVIAANRFLAALQSARELAEARRVAREKLAAVRIQAVWRMAIAMDSFRIVFQGVLVAQSFWRMVAARRAFLEALARRKAADEARRAAQAAAKAEAAAAQAAAEAAEARAVEAAQAAARAAEAERREEQKRTPQERDDDLEDEVDAANDDEDEDIEEDDEDEEEADRLREQAMRCQQQMQLMMIKEAILAENERRENGQDDNDSMSTIPEENEDEVSSWASRSRTNSFVLPQGSSRNSTFVGTPGANGAGVAAPAKSSVASAKTKCAGSAPGPPPPLPPKPEHKRGTSLHSLDGIEDAKSSTASFKGTADPASLRNLQKRTTTSASAAAAAQPTSCRAKPPPPPPKSSKTLQRQSEGAKTSGDRPLSARLGRGADGKASSSAGGSGASKSSGRGNRQMTGRKQRLHSRRASIERRGSTEHDQKKQRTIFLRLRQEERSYVDALSIINGSYCIPILETLITEEVGSTKGLLRQDAEAIFSNLSQLLDMHSQMLSSIEEELAKQKHNPAHAMTPAFLSKLRESLPYLRTVYLVYVKQNSTSLRILARARSEVPKFSKFLRTTAENKTLPSYGTDLRDLLKIPINQMARYNEFLNMLLACTHPDSNEHRNLRDVCKLIEGITRELDNERRLARLRMRAYEIANELEGVGKPAWKRKGKTQLLNHVNNPRSHHSLMDLSAAAAFALQGQGAHQSLQQAPQHQLEQQQHLEQQQQQLDRRHSNIESESGSPPPGSDGAEDANAAPQSHILVPGRQFLCEWVAPLSVSERKLDEDRPTDVKPKNRAFFLFSDVLVVAKKVATRKYDLRMWIDLSKIWVDASHVTPAGNKTARVREQFEEAMTDRNERVYPLQIVYISMAHGVASTGHTSLAIRLLQNASGGQKKRKTGRQDNLAPRVENLILWFRSPIQRREAFQNLTAASKALKKRREQLAKMQTELVGKGAVGAAVVKAAKERLAHLAESPLQPDAVVADLHASAASSSAVA